MPQYTSLPFAALPPQRPRKQRQQQGAALALVVTMILLLTLVGTSMLSTSSQNFMITNSFDRSNQASQIAKSALHLVSHTFSYQGNELVLHMMNNSGTIGSIDPCLQPRTLCFTAQSLMPRKNAETNTRYNGAFSLDAFSIIDKDNLDPLSNTAPSIRPDFLVRATNPVKSKFSNYSPGNSLEQNNVCTYNVTLFSTGILRYYDPDLSNTAPVRAIAEKTYRATITLTVIGGQLCS